VVDDNGVPSFDRLRYRRRDGNVVLCAFDLVELNGQDLRPHPIERRKAWSVRAVWPMPLIYNDN